MMQIKTMMEQKTALDKNNSMSEYTNPGPVENNIYVPTHDGIGNITTSTVGGDVDVKSLADLDYYLNELYGALRVPKQYFNQTDDSTGFNGGSSLTIISSRYAKMIKRIQNAILQALTDAINLMLIDSERLGYVNKYKLHMVVPTTQEEIDRQENLSSKIQLTQDIMNMLGDIDDTGSRLKILKALLSAAIDDTGVINIIQDEIDKLEQSNESEESESSEDTLETDTFEEESPDRSGPPSLQDLGSGLSGEESTEEPESPEEPEEQVLPSPNDLGVDLSNEENT